MVQAVNNYEKDVYNGDPGYISEIDPKARRVIVNYPSASSGSQSYPILYHCPLDSMVELTAITSACQSAKAASQPPSDCHTADLNSAHSLFLQPDSLSNILLIGQMILPHQSRAVL